MLLRTFGVLSGLLPCGFLEESSKIMGMQEQVFRFSFSQFLSCSVSHFCAVWIGKGLSIECVGVEWEGEECEAGASRVDT